MTTLNMTIIIHEIATDGLPDMERLALRVAFLHDGCIISGWPLPRNEFAHLYDQRYILERRGQIDTTFINQGGTLWEADSDIGSTGLFSGVTHWIEFPIGLHVISSVSEATK